MPSLPSVWKGGGRMLLLYQKPKIQNGNTMNLTSRDLAAHHDRSSTPPRALPRRLKKSMTRLAAPLLPSCPRYSSWSYASVNRLWFFCSTPLVPRLEVAGRSSWLSASEKPWLRDLICGSVGGRRMSTDESEPLLKWEPDCR